MFWIENELCFVNNTLENHEEWLLNSHIKKINIRIHRRMQNTFSNNCVKGNGWCFCESESITIWIIFSDTTSMFIKLWPMPDPETDCKWILNIRTEELYDRGDMMALWKQLFVSSLDEQTLNMLNLHNNTKYWELKSFEKEGRPDQ